MASFFGVAIAYQPKRICHSIARKYRMIGFHTCERKGNGDKPLPFSVCFFFEIELSVLA